MDLAQALERGRQIALQPRVLLRLARKPIQVFSGSLDGELACLGCTRQVLDRLLKLEKKRIGELSHVVGAPLSSHPLSRRFEQPTGERKDNQRHRRDTDAMASDEFPRPIPGTAPPGGNGQALAVSTQILSELLHRRVATLRFLAQRLQHDGVEVAREATTKLVRRVASGLAHSNGGARLERFLLTNRSCHFVVASGRFPVGLASGEKNVEDDSEGINVARSRDGVSSDLLGTGEGRRQKTYLRHRLLERCRLGLENLRHAEIEELGNAFFGNEDVAGLDVAVDNQVSVRILHRAAHRGKQLEPARNGETVRVAIGVEVLAIDVLHHEVGQTFFGCSAIQQRGDVRMRERGENLPLVAKARDDEFRAHPALDDLDRNLLVVRLVHAFGEVHRAHSAAPKLADELVRTDSRTLKRRSSLGPLRQSWVVSVFVSLRLGGDNPCRRGRGSFQKTVRSG